MTKILQSLLAAVFVAAIPIVASSPDLSSRPGTDETGKKLAMSPALRMSDNILITHAVLAALAWSFFVPLGAIVLRLNIQSPLLLKIHVYLQMCSYLIYIIAVGLGIWLARESAKYKPTWSNPHVVIGLVILLAALFQPFLGLIHHEIFKKHLLRWRAGLSMQRPGRTVLGRVHVWNGRMLITLGTINGACGIRLASTSPFQDAATTRKAYIGFGVAAGTMWLLYAGVSGLFEFRRTVRERSERQADGHIKKSEDPQVPYRPAEELKS
jgi:uncharacterized membrane protein